MTQLQITFNVTRFTLLASNKVELTGRKIFQKLTTITVTQGTTTSGPILKGAATAAIRFSLSDFTALVTALAAVPTLELPVTLHYDDPAPTNTTGRVTVNGVALGTPVSPAVMHALKVAIAPPPPTPSGGTGALEQIAAELRIMNGQLTQGLELLRELRNEGAPKSARGRNVRTLPPRRKTGT
jgi:hypothetical protein